MLLDFIFQEPRDRQNRSQRFKRFILSFCPEVEVSSPVVGGGGDVGSGGGGGVFTNRLINSWSNLPPSIVLTGTLNSFKNPLGNGKYTAQGN